MHQLEDNRTAAAHEALFDRYCPAIFAYLRSHTPSREDAEDLTLEVFTAALENLALPTWNERRQLAWLKRVAHNKLANNYRHARRHSAVGLNEEAESIPAPDDPEHLVLHHEVYRQLHRSIQQLSPLQQQILLLRYGHGLPTAEIARLLQKSDQAIRQMLSRTVSLLKTMQDNQDDRKGE